jgi:hypothetical protein
MHLHRYAQLQDDASFVTFTLAFTNGILADVLLRPVLPISFAGGIL